MIRHKCHSRYLFFQAECKRKASSKPSFERNKISQKRIRNAVYVENSNSPTFEDNKSVFKRTINEKLWISPANSTRQVALTSIQRNWKVLDVRWTLQKHYMLA